MSEATVPILLDPLKLLSDTMLGCCSVPMRCRYCTILRSSYFQIRRWDAALSQCDAATAQFHAQATFRHDAGMLLHSDTMPPCCSDLCSATFRRDTAITGSSTAYAHWLNADVLVLIPPGDIQSSRDTCINLMPGCMLSSCTLAVATVLVPSCRKTPLSVLP